MQKNLVIVESPAKAKTIEKFLGADFKVMSSYGHIRDLKKKNLGIDLDTFELQYEIPAERKHLVSELKSAASKSEAVWLASDEDREGEAISWHLAEVLGLDPKTTRRIVFHEITKPAIMEAIANPRHIDLNLVDAQQARRVLDRLVGFKISPILWRKVRSNLSAGRVQSVIVRLIVEREREINAFVTTSTYKVMAFFDVPTPDGSVTKLKAELNKTFPTKQEAEAFLQACKDATFTIDSITTRPTKRTPAPPFTTSTLQQEANRKLGFPVQMTMRVAQSLYENGRITYMRTDSVNLSDLCLRSTAKEIEESVGKGYHKRRTYHTSSKGAQEAHEAIRPTHMENKTIAGSDAEKKLYELIWKRTLACQMADAQLERTTVTVNISGKKETFTATGEVLKFDGFLRVYRDTSNDNDDENEAQSESALLPAMQEGQQLQRSEIVAQQRFSHHPPRYTDGSLVKKLEELGIGRPSTYASFISTIQQRNYVEKADREGTPRNYCRLTLTGNTIEDATLTEMAGSDRGKLIPTDIGLVVNDFLMSSFPAIMDYNFTASVEKELDEVAEGKLEWTKLLASFDKGFEKQVEEVSAQANDHRVGERELGTDPKSGRVVIAKIGKFGSIVQVGRAGEDEKPVFASIPSTLSLETITLAEALELFKLPRLIGEYEGEPVKANTGRFGPYVALGKTFVSIPEGEDPLDITLERAVELIKAKREAQAKTLLKRFDEDADMEVKTGRFGPYIAYKGKNYRLPKDKVEGAADLTYEACMALVEEAQSRPAKPKRAATSRRKTSSK